MCELSLAASVLAVDFTDALGFEATGKDAIPLLAAGGNAEAMLAYLEKLSRGGEAAGIWLWTRSRYLKWSA